MDYRKEPLDFNKDLKKLSEYIKALNFGDYSFKIVNETIVVNGNGSFGNPNVWYIKELPIKYIDGMTYGQWVDLLIEISNL